MIGLTIILSMKGDNDLQEERKNYINEVFYIEASLLTDDKKISSYLYI